MEKIPQENMFLPNLEHILSQPMPKKILVLSSPNTSFSASTTSGKGCGGVDRWSRWSLHPWFLEVLIGELPSGKLT